MAVFLLDAGSDAQAFAAVKERLTAAIPDLVEIANVGEIAQRRITQGDRTVVVIAAPSADREQFSRLLEIVTRFRGAIFFVLIRGEISATDYKTLVQSGNADWVSEKAPSQEIVDIIARLSLEPAKPKGPDVVTFAPSAGGVGNSTLAIETGVQLAKAKGGVRRKVCLIDLDAQTSHVCDYLDIEPRLQIEELIRAPQRLDAQLLENFSSRHGSGLHVFAAPRNRLRGASLSIEALDALFERIAQNYEFILVDLPVEWYSWTIHVLAASHGIVVTGANVIPGLHQISETLAAIRSNPGINAQIRVVINRCNVDVLGRVARREHVHTVLGGEQVIFVRETRMAEECVNIGSPMTIAQPSQKVVREIGAITEFCVRLNATTAPKAGR